MKKLQVPLILQEKDSIDCGPTCVLMVLEYFGIKRTLKELKDKLYYNNVGTSAYDNGSLLIDNKLKVMAITAQPLLFPLDIQEKLNTKDDILSLVKDHINKKDKFVEVLKTMQKYLNKSGQLDIAIPSFNHIKKAIDEENPMIAFLNAQSLGSNEGEWHSVVVCGYDETNVFINNPWPLSKHQGWFPVDRFLYGLHTSTLVDIDNGTLLVVSSK